MILTVLQENIHKALGKTIRILSGKPQLPILSHVLLKTSSGVFSITTTNTETTIINEVPAKVESEGSVCVPAKLLFDLISSLPKETVSLSLNEETLVVKTPKTKAILPIISSSEYPPISEISKKQGVDIPNNTLRAAMSAVLYAAATEDSRPLLTGVRIESTEQGAIFVCTDGYRLSKKSVPGERFSENVLIIPSRSMQEVHRIAGEEKETQTIRMSETVDGQILFSIGDTMVITRRIDGEYPNYQRIIPTSYTTQVRIDTQELQQAVKSAAVFARDSAGIIRVVCSPTGIQVSANTPQVGENVIDVDAVVEGEGGELALNSRFLQDLLSNYEGKEIVLQMTGALNPAVFKNPDDDTFLHIIMPVRVQR